MTVSSDTAAPLPAGAAHPSKVAWLWALALSLATALAIIAPFFWLGNASGHDFSFHAASWMDAAAQWRDGIWYPRWTDGANFGFGEPRFIFYPPLSWMFGAALSFVVPWEYVPGVFIVVTQMLAGLSAFALGRRLLPGKGAFITAVGYAANPYALLIVYMRSDFAEQLAMVFFPLLILAALEISGQLPGAVDSNGQTKPVVRTVALLAVVFASVWLTNAPAAVIATYSLGLLFLLAAFASKSLRPLLQGLAALALGFGLASFYLIPAVYEQRWVNISTALASGLQPSQNFLYAIIADTEHNAFNWIASSTAVLMIVLTALFAAATFAHLRKPAARSVGTSLWTALAVLLAIAALLMVRFTNVLWNVLPELRFVQFPWRWMSILAVPFACFAGAAISMKTLPRWLTTLTLVGLFAVLVGAATFMVRHTWWDTEDIPVLLEAIGKDEGFEGVDEYDPAGDDHSNLPEKSARVKLLADDESEDAPDPRPGAKVHIESWTAERKELRVTLRAPGRLALRLLNYPGWRVTLNDVAAAPEQNEDSDQIILPLPAGTSHVEARLLRTADRTVGGIVSGCSVGVALGLWLFAERNRMKPRK
jgi:hypothetical protein